MNWIDILTILVMLVVIIIFTLRGRGGEGKPGMGATLFDTVAVVVAAWIAHRAYRWFAGATSLSQPLSYIIIFVALGAIFFFLSSRLYALTQLNFHPFDAFISFFLAIVSAWAFAYVLLEVIASATRLGTSTADAFNGSRVANEILEFRTIRGGAKFMDTLRFIEREPWEQPGGGQKPSQVR